MTEPSKYCDLVMKGGITSGLVYPNAVLALSSEFRFKSIGGTSAGAIAASATAAASMGDRAKLAGSAIGGQEPDNVGFEGLRHVASELSTEGFIYSLFQPAQHLAGAYGALVASTGRTGLVSKLTVIVASAMLIVPVKTALILAVLLGIALAIGGWPGVLSALLPSLACAYLGGVIFAGIKIAAAMRKNLLGLCSGMGARREIVRASLP